MQKEFLVTWRIGMTILKADTAESAKERLEVAYGKAFETLDVREASAEDHYLFWALGGEVW